MCRTCGPCPGHVLDASWTCRAGRGRMRRTCALYGEMMPIEAGCRSAECLASSSRTISRASCASRSLSHEDCFSVARPARHVSGTCRGHGRDTAPARTRRCGRRRRRARGTARGRAPRATAAAASLPGAASREGLRRRRRRAGRRRCAGACGTASAGGRPAGRRAAAAGRETARSFAGSQPARGGEKSGGELLGSTSADSSSSLLTSQHLREDGGGQLLRVADEDEAAAGVPSGACRGHVVDMSWKPVLQAEGGGHLSGMREDTSTACAASSTSTVSNPLLSELNMA